VVYKETFKKLIVGFYRRNILLLFSLINLKLHSLSFSETDLSSSVYVQSKVKSTCRIIMN